jgi:hypothetical protein
MGENSWIDDDWSHDWLFWVGALVAAVGTALSVAWWAAANAALAVAMALLASTSEGSTRVICLIVVVLAAGLAVAGVVAVAKLRQESSD